MREIDVSKVIDTIEKLCKRQLRTAVPARMELSLAVFLITLLTTTTLQTKKTFRFVRTQVWLVYF